jgi:hypothetical protein
MGLALAGGGSALASQGPIGIEGLGPGLYCSKTSAAAEASCKHEVKEEYHIGRGACINTDDSDDRDECMDEIVEARHEGGDECKDQFEAREEVCELIGQGRYDPDYEPEDFVNPELIGLEEGDIAPNPLFPLVPGMKWVYEAEDEIIIVEVLEDTIEIDGVTCAVVRDVVYETGEGDEDEEGENNVSSEHDDYGVPVEDTLDWFAQDVDGNVWYFGEISLNYEDGQVTDVDGSWKTGEDGARAGILMPADPRVGEIYRQEFLLGEAEDMAEVISLVATPDLGEDNVAACDGDCLQTLEWTPLEEDSIEYKYYQAGVGMVQEADPEDPDSTVELVEFTLPAD